jgi:hypothetical protein
MSGFAHSHPPGTPGTFDESERRVPWDELLVARFLVEDGHVVRSLAARSGRGPTADFDVCGIRTEVKTLDPGATSRTVLNALRRGREQGDTLIVNATDSGLSKVAGERGVGRFSGRGDLGRVGHVCVLGDGFVLSYSRRDLLRMPARGELRLDPGP